MTDSNNTLTNQSGSDAAGISAYQPPAQVPQVNAAQNVAIPAVDPESLESQNIFELLGVNDGSESDKEAFLDELQQVIWQDFLDNDLRLLLTKEELIKVTEMQAKNPDKLQQQEEIVGFLENLIPDLENLMLEKALELKREMVKERIGGLKEFLAGQPEKLAFVQMAESQIERNKWATAAVTLNKI